jgi:hypothetical protein
MLIMNVIVLCNFLYGLLIDSCRHCAVKTNDQMLVIYLSSLIRSVIALHNLINNKVRLYYQVMLLVFVIVVCWFGFIFMGYYIVNLTILETTEQKSI